MAKPWSSVETSPQYQALAPDQQKAAKQQYFDSVVAPQVSKTDLDAAKMQFLGSSDSLSWSSTLGKAITNVPSSAIGQAKSIYSAVRHPIDTAEAIGSVGVGEAEKLDDAIGLNKRGTAPTIDEQHAQAMNDFFTHRYGSMDNFKKAVATDPVGVMTDLSSVLTGVGGLAARAPGMVGKIGEAVTRAGELANPVALGGKVLNAVPGPAGRLAATTIGSLGTHTGAEPLKIAYQSGRAGGNASEAFLDNMRGNAPIEDVVTSAKSALSQMRQDRNAAYKAGMAGVSKDKTVLDFAPIDAAMAKVEGIKKFKGQDIQPETAEVRQQLNDILTVWKSLPSAEFHTPEGMDALKQRIGSVKDNLPYNSPQRAVADAAYNAVREEVIKQAPQYSKVMKEYTTASDLIEQMQKTLSLNPKANVDTTLRKLQSIMRNNVSTNYGQRAKLGEKLAQKSPNIPYQLAGQALSKGTPRGLGSLVAGSELTGAGMAALLGHPGVLAAAIPTLALQSPRLTGEAAHAAGTIARYLATGTIARYLATPAGKVALAAITKGAPYAAEAGRVPDITKLISSPGF